MLTLKEMRQLGLEELMEEIAKINREFKRLKLDVQNGSSKETHRLKLLKIQRARLNTVMTENRKEAATAKPAEEKEEKKPAKKVKAKSK